MAIICPFIVCTHFLLYIFVVAGWPATTQSWCRGLDVHYTVIRSFILFYFLCHKGFLLGCVCVCVVSWLSLLLKAIQAHSLHGYCYCCIMFLLYVCLPSATHTQRHTSALAVDFLCIISTNDWCYSPYGWSTHKHSHTHNRVFQTSNEDDKEMRSSAAPTTKRQRRIRAERERER